MLNNKDDKFERLFYKLKDIETELQLMPCTLAGIVQNPDYTCKEDLNYFLDSVKKYNNDKLDIAVNEVKIAFKEYIE